MRDAIGTKGFAIISAVLNSEEVSQLADHLDRAPLTRSRAGARHLMSDAAIARLVNHPALLQIAGEVLGHQAFPFRATYFDKSAMANWLVSWHQDRALPLRCRLQDVPGWGPWSVKSGVIYAIAPTRALKQVLALRIHLDDSTSLNGPLRVLPGTHVLGVLSNDVAHELAMKVSPEECLVPQGGVLAMRPLLIHSSSKCGLEVRRRVLHVEYAASNFLGDGMELAVC